MNLRHTAPLLALSALCTLTACSAVEDLARGLSRITGGASDEGSGEAVVASAGTGTAAAVPTVGTGVEAIAPAAGTGASAATGAAAVPPAEGGKPPQGGAVAAGKPPGTPPAAVPGTPPQAAPPIPPSAAQGTKPNAAAAPPASPGTASGSLCSNTCSTAHDSECDDGGPNSMYSICTLGTDCADCGPRNPGDGTAGNLQAPGGTGTLICSNTCASANDRECDDGGPGSMYSVCNLGTDCADCGPRTLNTGSAFVDRAINAPPGSMCLNSCTTARDGECDDGGPDSMYAMCTWGTDCSDCGPRNPAPPTTGTLCSNTCASANDSECDDGGPGSLYSVCGLGTDCNDCGARQAGAPGRTGNTLCTNTCNTARDGECDDGGPGSMYSICQLGSDCADCGARVSN